MKPKTPKGVEEVERRRALALDRILAHDIVHDLTLVHENACTLVRAIESILILAHARDEANRVFPNPPPTTTP